MDDQNENSLMLSHPIKLEPSRRWVRVKYGEQFIADSKQPLLLLAYGPGRLPTYFFSPNEVRSGLLQVSEKDDIDEVFGPTAYWHVQAGERLARNAAWAYTQPPDEYSALKDRISFHWPKMDAWYEEEEVFVHARDPYKRVDVMPSSRHLRVEINGVTLADTKRPYLLFETRLPVRYYIPREDVNMDLLEPSGTHSQCPYKGVANYWSAEIEGRSYKDIVWSYQDPIPESPKIRELLSFYNERVDIYLDGELQARPVTPWS